MCYTCTPKGDHLEIEGKPCPPEVIDAVLNELARIILDDYEAKYEAQLLEGIDPVHPDHSQ